MEPKLFRRDGDQVDREVIEDEGDVGMRPRPFVEQTDKGWNLIR